MSGAAGGGGGAEALESLNEALSFYRKAGDEDERVATALSSATGVQDQGMLSKTLKGLFKKEAPRIEKKANEDEHADVQGALERLEKSLKSSKKRLGPDHPEVATGLDTMAKLMKLQGNPSEAVCCFRESLRIWEAVLGGDHPHVGSTHLSIGRAHIDMGDYEEAQRDLNKAFRILSKAHGEESKEVADVQFAMAVSYRAEGNDGLSKRLFKAAARVYARELGPDHIMTKGSLEGSK